MSRTGPKTADASSEQDRRAEKKAAMDRREARDDAQRRRAISEPDAMPTRSKGKTEGNERAAMDTAALVELDVGIDGAEFSLRHHFFPTRPASASVSAPLVTSPLPLDTRQDTKETLMIVTNALPVGIEVLGLDLSQPIDSQTGAQLKQLLDQHQLLVFKNQNLSDDEHIKAMDNFGPPAQEEGADQCSFVSNVRPDGVLGDGDLLFHIDYCFRPHKANYVSLYGYEVGGASMPTGYANSIKAVDRLPHSLRKQLEGRHAVHAMVNDAKYRQRIRLLDSPDPSAYLQKRRPVFEVHSRTGGTVLALYELFTSHIEGYTSRENEELIEAIFNCAYSKEHIYLHHWQQGDLVIWDNMAVQHSRRLIEGAVREVPRTLRRVSVCEKDLRWEENPRSEIGG